MRVESINSYNVIKKKQKSFSKSSTSSKTRTNKDTFTISKESSRKLTLESIKSKIKSGFYNSDEVMDDISNKLSSVLNNG